MFSVTQRLPSDPAAIHPGPDLMGSPASLNEVGRAYSVMWGMSPPSTVMRPIRSVLYAVYQKLPSRPYTRSTGQLSGVGSSNSVMSPVDGLRRPILFPLYSVNQMLPSGLDASQNGSAPAVGI